MDGFLVPATAEPLITCTLNGSAESQERDIGGAWLPRRIRRGDIFVTGSKTPYEVRWRSIETLAELAELSPFHFSRVFKQTTGMTPLQFEIQERMLQARNERTE
ncbi:MAG TPA: AraC family transcriptional regulator [Chthoniobacterales bacterium]|nr:AraC family transcriptional regulator [Chthoniobacterales bacterium]